MTDSLARTGRTTRMLERIVQDVKAKVTPIFVVAPSIEMCLTHLKPQLIQLLLSNGLSIVNFSSTRMGCNGCRILFMAEDLVEENLRGNSNAIVYKDHTCYA